jgi:hypothetical protein
LIPLLIVGILAIGFILGLACAIAIATAAGYNWSDIMHSWYLGLVYLRHKAEIDEEIGRDVRRANDLGADWIKH